LPGRKSTSDVNPLNPVSIPSLSGPAGERAGFFPSSQEKTSFAFSPLQSNKRILVCVELRKFNSKIASLVENGVDDFCDHASRAKKSSIVLLATVDAIIR
jgi:hypothetical protein